MAIRAWAWGVVVVGVVGCVEPGQEPAHDRQALQPAGLSGRAPVGPYLDGALPSVSGGAAPATLSATGAFTHLSTLQPSAVFVPFGLNSPGWSDGAKKSRWVAVPNDGAPYTAAERIGFAANGPLTFPIGTVLMKHFELVTDETTGARKRLETRFLVRDAAGTWYGLGYKWRDDQSDADLIGARVDGFESVVHADGSTTVQKWTYPGPQDCTRCHRPASGSVLGVSTRQLNGPFTYPTGLTDNQLNTWNELQLFDPPLVDADIPTYPKLVAISDTTATLEDRVRSFVDTNCSDCHQPGGPGPLFDARYLTPIENQNLANGALKRKDLSLSKMYQRDTSLTNPMPPIARNVVDEAAMQVVAAWVNDPFDVASAVASDDTHVTVTFTSPLDAATANVAANYAIGGVTVSAAAASGNSVTLTTSPLSVGVSYTLTVNRVREAAAPKNPIWPATTFGFSYAGPSAPVTVADAFTTAEDTALTVAAPGVLANDTGTGKVAQLTTPPAHGTLALAADGSFTYTPTPGFSGADAFGYRASPQSAPAAVTLTVTAVNDAPVAVAQSVATAEDTALALTLGATDEDSATLGFTLVSQPQHGTLTGTPPNLVYTPAADFSGADGFTFRANDGALDSADASVVLTVTAVNDAPLALPLQLSATEDTALPLLLTATDVDSPALTFAVTAGPTHGTLTGTPPNLVYTPAADFSGTDEFTFTAHDGSATSAPATVWLTVVAANDPPVASPLAVTTPEDVAVDLTLAAADPDSAQLTFTIATPPSHGTLNGNAYTPAPDFHGTDSFTFTASDGLAASAPATVTITVTPVNDAPVAADQNARALSGQAHPLTLLASDADGDALTFALLSMPTHGALTGAAPHLVYTPAPQFTGEDTFTFRANDGSAASGIATVRIVVGLRNAEPKATAQHLAVDEDAIVEVTLTGTDPDGDALTFAIATPPEHGTLVGTVPNVRYRPAADFHGADAFTFSVSDGLVTTTALVRFDVAPVNDAPIAVPGRLSVEGGSPVAIHFAGTDADGDALTFRIVAAPAHGTLTGSGSTRLFTPDPDYEGDDPLTFVANDGTTDSPAAIVVLVLKPKAPAAIEPVVQQPPEPLAPPIPARTGCSAAPGALMLLPLAFALWNRRRNTSSCSWVG